jgi:hypothetical protein
MATLTTVKISSQLDERNRARLEAKSYTRQYTDVPNRALPENLRAGLNAIYKVLSGEDLDPDGSTFTVRADPNGTFKRLYSPTVLSTAEKGLVVRWGDRDFPLTLAPGKVGTAFAPKNAKFAFKEETFGKFTDAVLTVSVPEADSLYVFPIPVRSADFEDKVSADLLDLLLDENPEAIAEKVAIASDLSKRGESSGERMFGEFVKVAQLPLGEYKVTTYRAKEGGDYGTQYYLQVQIPEPFTANVRKKIEGTDTYGDVETEIVDWAIIKPNSKLKKILAAEPVITPDAPSTLRVLSHDTFNGFDTAEVALKCASFAENVDAFSLDF